MVRRSLSGLVLGLSLVLASAAWAGFVLTRTALDPSRSETLADEMIDNEQLRGALSSRLAEAIQGLTPADVPIPRQEFEAAADTALDDPSVQALIRDGLVTVHQNALNGVDEDVELDATALGLAARTALVGGRPELDAVIPALPQASVTLPTGGLSVLGTIRDRVQQFTILAALAAIVGACASLILARDRPAILRRVAFWAFGAAAFWLVLGFGLPRLIALLAPNSVAVVSAAVNVFLGSMIQPAIVMAAVGGALLGGSMLWSALKLRRPARMLVPPVAEPVLVNTPAPAAHASANPRAGLRSNVRPGSSGAEVPATGSPRPVPQRAPSPLAVDHTMVFPTAQPSPRPHVGAPTEARPEWIPGVGYLDPVTPPTADPDATRVERPTNQ